MSLEYVFGGTDEENAELRRLNLEVNEDSDNFESWEKLVRAAEAQEGGLNRNSNPQAITATRQIYDRFLGKFPLLFGYWKKYADLEFAVSGVEAAEMVYERGVASIPTSVDLWTNYCGFKADVCHEYDAIRELFERGANHVGLDFLSHLFWDKYIEFEERLESIERIFAVLGRVIRIPMHQYARYIERYRQLAQTRPVNELAPPELLAQFRVEVDGTAQGLPPGSKSEAEIERDLRLRINTYHMEILSRTQTETTKRWTYEAEIKRPYFHVTELDEPQLANWRRYLDFEEAEGDFERIQFLYERCLVTCAFYDEFWFRYARWMLAQKDKEEEVRNIYIRAGTIFVPIARPSIRLQWAYFEEMCGRVDIARDIYDAILVSMPNHLETILAKANMARRYGGYQEAIDVFKSHLETPGTDTETQAAFISEWAKMLWKIKGSPEEAREVYEQTQRNYVNCRIFWENYLQFELAQPTSAEIESAQHLRIKKVIEEVRSKSNLDSTALRYLIQIYMSYLLERGTGAEAAKEYMILDQEINGPMSVQRVSLKPKPEKIVPVPAATPVPGFGSPAVASPASATTPQPAVNPYAAYYAQQQMAQHPAPMH